jgi:antitoxin FitA
MPKTIQIRDIDDEVYAGLRRRAAEEGVTVPELLRAEAARLAAQPSIGSWLASTRRRSSAIAADAVVQTLDEIRDDRR